MGAGLLIASGVVLWLALGWVVAATLAVALLRWHPLRKRLDGPGLYPYTAWARTRLWGVLLSLLRGVYPPARKVPAEVVKAFGSAKLEEFRLLEGAMKEVDALPTVRRGLAALGLRSIFEVPSRGVQHIPSPYTNPLQRPAYYIPGVPARTFYDHEGFDWVEPLERAFPVIREELLALLEREGRGFKGYLNESNVRMEGWNTFNFFFYGRKFEENCALCPRTTAVLESLPRFEKDHIMFSALNPHSHILPHTGPMNGIIRGHLPLLVPPGCYIRVGKDERTWEEGRTLIFDDSFEHEVWNHSDQVRIVLFMNFWHPCLSAEEIAVLSRFRTAYEQSPLGRVHEDNQAAPRAHDIAKPAAAGLGPRAADGAAPGHA